MTLTPDDLRDSNRAGGYRRIESASPSAKSAGIPNVRPRWRAIFTSSPTRRRGPIRFDPMQAAQDFCDYVNGNPSAPSSAPLLKSAGHSGSRTPETIPSDIEAAYGMIRDFKAQQQGKQGYVYLIVEEGATSYGKIGFSTNPQARVRELQTGNPRVLKLYATKLGTLEDERALHKRHKANNVLQEWFRLDSALLSEFKDSSEEAA